MTGINRSYIFLGNINRIKFHYLFLSEHIAKTDGKPHTDFRPFRKIIIKNLKLQKVFKLSVLSNAGNDFAK